MKQPKTLETLHFRKMLHNMT